eukprot:CAMPEP_0117549810 /NCGR_PEP_ID=MMETSP0784-20121206/48358_1 /TAXON_ID=39447 /ORGANISM="" /LENGTH=284 /DNA_ID=CAMNT_0005346811 /DNA_START=49 /DNA_END=903 /DNA_ORIENTATION=+
MEAHESLSQKSFCSRAHPCLRCGTRPTVLFGLLGFGLCKYRHDRRCAARAETRQGDQSIAALTVPALTTAASATSASSCAAPDTSLSDSALSSSSVSSARALHQPRELAPALADMASSAVPSSAPNALASLSTLQADGMQWLNRLLSELWPELNEATRKVAMEDVTPQIKEMLTATARGDLSFTKFTLGEVQAEVSPVVFHSMESGTELEMGLDMEAEVDIEISCAPMDIKKLRFQGTLLINVGSSIDEALVWGAIVEYSWAWWGTWSPVLTAMAEHGQPSSEP